MRAASSSCAVLSSKLTVQLHDAAADADAREHFAGIEWLHQVIVCSGFQAFDHSVFFVLLVIKIM